MAKSEATIVDAGGRELRVSSADRVIFPMTERSGAVTKLDIVNYYRPRQVLVLENRPGELPRADARLLEDRFCAKQQGRDWGVRRSRCERLAPS